MKVLSNTVDMILYLKSVYRIEDAVFNDTEFIGTPEYWKLVGVLELLDKIDMVCTSNQSGLKNVAAVSNSTSEV